LQPVNLSAGDSLVTSGVIAKTFRLWHFDAVKYSCFVFLLFAGWLLPAHAQQEADDKYIGIYGQMQQADHFNETGDPTEALAAYTDVQNQLLQLQRQYPDWNPNILKFRLNQVAGKIADLKNRAELLDAANKASQAGAPANPPPVTVAPAAAEVAGLRAQLQAAQAANEQLQAKLKEALAVQPAAVDPRELEQAREKIRWLMKQNDLLMVSHGPVAPARPVIQYVTNFVREVVTNTPLEVTSLAAVYERHPRTIVVTNFVSVVVPDTNALAMARLEYAGAVKNYQDEHVRAERLAAQLQELRSNPASVTNYIPAAAPDNSAALAALQAENARLRSQLAALAAAPAPATDVATLQTELKQSQALVAQLRDEAEIAALEKMALERKLRQVLTTNTAGVNAADYEFRIRQLTQDRDSLIEKLAAANKQVTRSRRAAKPDNSAEIAALTGQVSTLQARLAVAEAQPVPYSDEELALFKAVTPPPAAHASSQKSITEMPAGTAELVASAQQHFTHQEYAAAEADYLKILDRDQNNGIALANLATIEMQAGKLDEAEKNIVAAVAASPDDAYNLATLGYLKFREEKYDEALNALSRAAQIDPNNPEIQNYLGVTLSHKGQRKAAENALRRAVQINPDYAPAHNNLAVIYLTETPSFTELARWHYQKALAAGQPRNPDLEKMLADKGAPVAP
jgi:Tfp pilus assembly protein PilF